MYKNNLLILIFSSFLFVLIFVFCILHIDKSLRERKISRKKKVIIISIYIYIYYLNEKFGKNIKKILIENYHRTNKNFKINK